MNSSRTSFSFLFVAGLSSFSLNIAQGTPIELRDQITARRLNVIEFKVLADWSKNHGAHLWIAGESVKGLAQYVKEHPAHDAEYSYFSVYPTQSLELVIDGDGDSVQTLQKYLQENLGYLNDVQGPPRVRALSAVLQQAQHNGYSTQSYAGALIELTDPSASGSVCQDTYHWNSKEVPEFIQEEDSGTYRYTPPSNLGGDEGLLSVLDYYATVTQSNAAAVPNEIKTQLKVAVSAFDPAASVSELILPKLEELVQSAHLLDFLWSELDSLNDLKKKLIALATDRQDLKLARLLSRDPLSSHPLGQGQEVSFKYRIGVSVDPVSYRPTFKTAKELGLSRVQHIAPWNAVASMTVRGDGALNAIKSSHGFGGEEGGVYASAVYGYDDRNPSTESFARTGHYQSSLFPIFYDLDPNAVEGIDFYILQQPMKILEVDLVNAKAAKLIPSLPPYANFQQFFQAILDGKALNSNMTTPSKWVANATEVHLARRTLHSLLWTLSDAEKAELTKMVSDEVGAAAVKIATISHAGDRVLILLEEIQSYQALFPEGFWEHQVTRMTHAYFGRSDRNTFEVRAKCQEVIRLALTEMKTRPTPILLDMFNRPARNLISRWKQKTFTQDQILEIAGKPEATIWQDELITLLQSKRWVQNPCDVDYQMQK